MQKNSFYIRKICSFREIIYRLRHYLYFFSQNTNYFGSSFQAPYHTITYPAAACNDRHNSHQTSTLGEAEAAQDHPDLQFQRPERIYSAGENRDFFLGI